VLVVSGLPRSGTSLMMQMLERAGVPLFTDAVREADESNPRGYLEHEAVKRLASDQSWLPRAENKAVKVVSHLLVHLPPGYAYKVILMQRDIDEVVNSQQRMLERDGADSTASDPTALEAAYRQNLRRVERWAADNHVSLLTVNHHDVMNTPLREAERVCRFLGIDADPAALAAVVDTGLYRSRKS
jgi:hypothetical protein